MVELSVGRFYIYSPNPILVEGAYGKPSTICTSMRVRLIQEPVNGLAIVATPEGEKKSVLIKHLYNALEYGRRK